MSDYYHYTLDFKLRRDTPAAVINAFRAAAKGEMAKDADLAVLPPVVASYLQSGDWTGHPSDLAPTTRLSPFRMPYSEERPADAIWKLHYERVFHDDEFWNGGMYLIYWLYSFAAGQGHLATMQLEYDAPPEITTRIGADVVITTLGYNPETHQPLDFRDTPLDAEEPVTVRRVTRFDLSEMLENIAFMAEDGQ